MRMSGLYLLQRWVYEAQARHTIATRREETERLRHPPRRTRHESEALDALHEHMPRANMLTRVLTYQILLQYGLLSKREVSSDVIAPGVGSGPLHRTALGGP
jgi:hypothetical protein